MPELGEGILDNAVIRSLLDHLVLGHHDVVSVVLAHKSQRALSGEEGREAAPVGGDGGGDHGNHQQNHGERDVVAHGYQGQDEQGKRENGGSVEDVLHAVGTIEVSRAGQLVLVHVVREREERLAVLLVEL